MRNLQKGGAAAESIAQPNITTVAAGCRRRSRGARAARLRIIKADIVEGLFRSAEAAGLRLQLVDVSPAALCNAFRFNYSDLDGCSMLLDIGAKTSNLLLFEKGKVYSRSINIGANSITQDFSTESKVKFDEAEQIKIAEFARQVAEHGRRESD
jgi:type IV pilus assembly protein PilM